MKKQTFALMLSSILCSAYPVIAMDVDLEPTNKTVSFTKTPGNTYEVTTDDNAEANYQAVGKRIPVVPGQTIKVDYDVEVIQGVMSFGLLNTNRNGWYDEELVLKTGNYTGSFTRVVPENETETNLVLRNYHLGVGGQTTFKLNKLQMEIETPTNVTSGSTGSVPTLVTETKDYVDLKLRAELQSIALKFTQESKEKIRQTQNNIRLREQQKKEEARKAKEENSKTE